MKRLALFLLMIIVAGSAIAEEIASPAPNGASLPYLATTSDGALLMSWVEPTGKGGALKFATWRSGRWSAPRTIVEREDLMMNWANSPAILAADSTLYALWLQKRGNGHAADARLTASPDGGATWTKGVLIHRDGKETEHGFASLVPVGSDAAITWLDGREMTGHDQGEMTLRYARASANGTLTREAVLDSRVCECCGTGMAMTTEGPIIAYRDRSNNELRDIAVIRWVGGQWSKPAGVYRDGWTLKGCPLNGPQIEARGKRVAVAWFTAASEPLVNVAFSADAGATFAKPIRVDAGGSAGRVELLLLPNGDAMVIWLEGLGENASIVARRVSSSGPAGAVVKVGPTSGSRSSGFPRAAVAGNRAFVAWTDAAAKRIRVASLPTD